MTVGGDLATLRNLFTTLGTASSDVENVCSNIDKGLANTVWTGANATKFRDAWANFKPTLNPQLVTTLTDAKEDVRKQHNNLALATGESAQI